jgi:hypothetical protein
MTGTVDAVDPILAELDAKTDLEQSKTTDQRQFQEASRQVRPYRTLVAGGLLIFFGLLFLLQNFGMIEGDHWWAWLFLVPAGGAFAAAWSDYQASGHQLTAYVRRLGIVGVIFASLAGFFLLGLEIDIFGPLLVILVGIALVGNAFFRR